MAAKLKKRKSHDDCSLSLAELIAESSADSARRGMFDQLKYVTSLTDWESMKKNWDYHA